LFSSSEDTRSAHSGVFARACLLDSVVGLQRWLLHTVSELIVRHTVLDLLEGFPAVDAVIIDRRARLGRHLNVLPLSGVASLDRLVV